MSTAYAPSPAPALQPQIIYRRPWLYPKQAAAIFDVARVVVIEASTKSGKTVGCIIWLTECALSGRPGHQFWWVAPIRAQAKIAYNRLKRALPAALFESNETELTITLANGAVLAFKSAENPDSLFGEDVHAAVIDEASRTRVEAYYAVRSTLTATRGLLRIIGNVKGRKNWAYKLARRAESGARHLAYHKITAYDAVAGGVLHADEIRQAQEDYPEAVFAELFLAEASDDGDNPFGIANIRRNTTETLSTDAPAAWGWDLARKQDWTVGIALDRLGRMCRLERWRRSWSRTGKAIFELTGRTPAAVDATGVGMPVTERLQENASRQYGVAGDAIFEPFVFDGGNKQRLMEALAIALEHDEVTVLAGVTASELESFEFVYTRTAVKYGAPDGQHDDTVTALALAKYKLDQVLPGLTLPAAPLVSLEKASTWLSDAQDFG